MDPVYTIYRATCIVNGKSYIGFDSKYPNRQIEHRKDAEKNKRQCLFHRAIRKYGFDSFVWDVLYQSKDQKHTLNEMERHFIMENDSFGKNGYNMTLGGDGVIGFEYTEEHRRKMSTAHKGVPLSKEHRANIGRSNKGRIQTEESRSKQSAAKKGKAFSDAHKEALSKAKVGKPAKNRKPIILSGVSYESKAAAAEALNISWRQVDNLLSGKTTYKTPTHSV